jgi:hypothetical protein
MRIAINMTHAAMIVFVSIFLSTRSQARLTKLIWSDILASKQQMTREGTVVYWS